VDGALERNLLNNNDYFLSHMAVVRPFHKEGHDQTHRSKREMTRVLEMIGLLVRCLDKNWKQHNNIHSLKLKKA